MNYHQLTVEPVDTKTPPTPAMDYEAMKKGGNSPCILNAANESAVEAFLKDKIGFLQMSDVVERCLQTIDHIEKPGYDDYVSTDKETRRIAIEMITSR